MSTEGSARHASAAKHSILKVATLAALSALGVLATNILLPSLSSIGSDFDVPPRTGAHIVTVFLAVFGFGQLLVGPFSDRFGRSLPVNAGFAIFVLGSVFCAVAPDLPTILIGRTIQAAGACATSVLARAMARDLFSDDDLARTLTMITIAVAAAPGFSPLLGGTLESLWGWRASFIFLAAFACVAWLAYGLLVGETRPGTRATASMSTTRRYLQLLGDRRFIVPAATVTLIMSAMFAVFAATPVILIESMDHSPVDVGLYFAGTVGVVFCSGFVGDRVRHLLSFERMIYLGLTFVTLGGLAIIAVAWTGGGFLPFLGATVIFLVGFGIIYPLGTAQAMMPFAENAGAASALLGSLQMTGAAIGVGAVLNGSSNLISSLGIVLTFCALLSLLIYRLGSKKPTRRGGD